MKKRILASLLSLCLIVGLLPTAVLAADESGTEGESPAVCTCTALCAEGSVDETCPVCVEDDTLCAYTAPAEPAEEPGDEPVEEPTEGPAGEPEGPACAGLEGCDGDTHAEGCPLYVAPEEPADAQDGDKNTYYETDDVTDPVGLTALNPLADNEMSGNCGAEGNESNVTWKLEQNNQDSENPTYTLTISGTGKMKDYARVGDKGDVCDAPWYSRTANEGNITKLVIEEGITRVGAHAFRGSQSIKEISLPDTLQSIGDAAFKASGISGTLTIPSEVTDMGTYTFAGCVNLTGLELKNSPTQIGDGLFTGCTALTGTLSIPSSVTQIGAYSFYQNKFTGTLLLPNSLSKIGADAFAYTTFSGGVIIPKTVSEIAAQAFYNCSSLVGICILSSTDITFGSTGGFQGLAQGSTIYVLNDTIKESLASKYSHEKTQLAVTNGGTFAEDTDFKAKTLATPTKEGCIFAGWYTKDGTNDDWGEKVTTPTEGQTYYAKWVREITFNANGGEGEMTTQQVTEGDTSTKLTANTFTKTGYTFNGWNTVADGTGTSYANQATAPSTSTTLYAQWTPNTYTINFNGGTGVSGSTASVTATYDQPVTLTANGFTMTGKNFAGWASAQEKANAGTVEYSDQTEVLNLAESGEVTLYAVWTDKQVLDPDLTDTVVTYNGQPQKFHVDDTYTVKYYQNRMEVTDPTNAGIYDVEISCDEDNTHAAYHGRVMGGLVINKAPLTIKADDKSIRVGDALPTYTYTVTGLFGQDELITAPIVTCADADANTAGTYTITASGADAGKNYTITYVNGTLTVSRRSSGGGGGSSSGSTGNVTGSGDDVNIDVSGGSVTTAQMEKAVDKADRGETITIEASSRSSVSLPSSGLQDAADNNNDVTVELKNGEVTLSPEALSAVAEQAGTTVTLTVNPVDTDELNSRQQAAVGDAPVFDLTLKSGGKTITDFDGGLVTVAIPYELPDDQDPAGVVVWFMDDNGNITACETMYDLRTETVIFTTRHFSKYVIGYVEPMDFTDVAEGAYYYEAVAWAVQNGITEGTSATTFGPDVSCTRAQMVTFLWRAAGSPEATGSNPFTDVSTSAYYYDAVLWAVGQGITSGTSATMFSPDAVVSRGQTVTFLWRQAGAPVVDYAMSFADVPADAYYAEAVRWAVSEGVTSGTGATTFSPDAACTRSQIVTFLYRANA